MKARLHVVLTIVLAVVLCAVAVTWREHDAESRAVLRMKADENAVLRKRAETAEANTRLVLERMAGIMKSLASETGRLSGRTLAKHEKSFVQVYGLYRADGKNMATAGTACYLGGGYFLTARHVVIHEAEGSKPAKPKAVIMLNRELVDAQLVDSGNGEEKDSVDVDDWAILFVPNAPASLVPLTPKVHYGFVFGERLVRYGNDNNRGIAVAAGYVAQTSEAGWVSWLVDSSPGCSGGGVLNDREELVGLNGGFLDGNSRLAVLIPIRADMFRKLPRQIAEAEQ